MHKNRDHFYVILMFAVTSYTVHSNMKISYTIHTTRHITLKCALWEMYNHRYVSKVYLYSHDIYKGSMHNKRFIILCVESSFRRWEPLCYSVVFRGDLKDKAFFSNIFQFYLIALTQHFKEDLSEIVNSRAIFSKCFLLLKFTLQQDLLYRHQLFHSSA